VHENEISEKIIGCAIQVHRALGPGLLESVYQECLAAEMNAQDLVFEREKPVPVIYREVKLDCGYRVDFLVEGKVVLDLKAIEIVPPVMYAQVLTYTRLLNKKLGLLIKFDVEQLINGLKRVVNNLDLLLQDLRRSPRPPESRSRAGLCVIEQYFEQSHIQLTESEACQNNLEPIPNPARAQAGK